MNLSNILSTIVSHLQTSVQQEKLTAQRVRLVTTTICKVQEYVKVMNKLAIDEKEFALLKLTALFSTGKIHNNKLLQISGQFPNFFSKTIDGSVLIIFEK